MEREGAENLRKRSDAVSLAVVTGHVALVLLPVYLAVALQPGPLLVVWWCWFGFLQQGLLNLMHECAHLHVFKRRRHSEWLARWVLAPSMVVSFDRYREVHWAHHHELGTHRDPKYSYRVDIRGWRLVAFVLRSLLLIEAVRKIGYVHAETTRISTPVKSTRSSEPRSRWLLRTGIFHVVFVTTLLLTAMLSARRTPLEAIWQVSVGYIVVYLYGMLSLTVFAANLRAIAEHQQRGNGDDEVGDAALRNLTSSPLSQLVFGAYGFAEHATHHWNPGVPYYHLKAETRNWIEKKAHAMPRFGYMRAIYDAVMLPDASQRVLVSTSDGPSFPA